MNIISAEREQEYGVPYGADAVCADMDYINSKVFAKKFNNITDNPKVNQTLLECAQAAIAHRNGTLYEDMYLINGDTGEILGSQIESDFEQGIFYNDSIRAAIARARAQNIPLIAFHSHPEGYPPSIEDFNKAYENDYALGVIAGHNGQIYVYNAPDIFVEDTEGVQEDIVFAHRSGFDIDRAYQETFINYGLKYFIAKE